MKYTLRALASVGLLAGVYVLGAAVVAVFAAGVYELAVHGVTGALVGKLLIIGVVVALAIARGLWSGLRTPADQPAGVPLPADEQPRLWEEVRRLAEQLETRPPDEIRLVADVNAAVSESSRWLGLVGGTRRLYLGAPLLVGLSQRQLCSVLAHELGHYSGSHTALAGVTYRGQESLRRVVGHLGTDSVVGRLFGLYGRLYVAASGAVNRRQELEADEFSARVAGKEVAVSALRELAPLDAAWSFFVDAYASEGDANGQRPAELFDGFAQLWRCPDRQQQVEQVRADPTPAERSAYDTHPSLAERVAAIRVLDVPDSDDTSGPALEILDQPTRALGRLEDHLYDGSELAAVPWDVLVPQGAAARTHGHAGALVGAVEQGGDTRADLATVLAALRSGLAAELVEPLVHRETPTDQRLLLAGQLVGDLVADAGTAAGCAFRLSWAHGAELVDPAGEVLDPWGLARAAVQDPAATTALETFCESHAIATRHRVTPAPLHQPAGLEQAAPALEAAAFVSSHARSQFVFALNKGLVLKRCTLSDSMRIGIGGYAFHDHGSWALRSLLAARSAADLMVARRATFLPWDEIADAVLAQRSKHVRELLVRTRDGSVRAVTERASYTRMHGDLWGCLRHHLGDRFVEDGATATGSQAARA